MALPTITTVQYVLHPDVNELVPREFRADVIGVDLIANRLKIAFQWMGKTETREFPMPAHMGVTLCYN